MTRRDWIEAFIVWLDNVIDGATYAAGVAVVAVPVWLVLR